MKKTAFIISSIFCCFYVTAQKKAAAGDTLFFDDFKNNILDRTKWNVEVTGNTVNDEQQAYVDSSSVIYLTQGKAGGDAAKGTLIIQPLYHPDYVSKENKHYDFLSGRINTRSKFEFTYGTASARMKIAGGAGLWPAFWALGEGEWPDCGEIDIMETVGDPSWISHALHGPGYFGNTPIVHRETFPDDTNVTQWHIYSVTWTSESLIFRVDNKVTYTVTRTMIEKYGKWAFDNPKFIIVNFALGGGYPNSVNKITSPYFGLSQNTVNLIKSKQAKVLVDWVLVTKIN